MEKLCHSNVPNHRCTGQRVTLRVARATDSKDSQLPRVLKMGSGPIIEVPIVKVKNYNKVKDEFSSVCSRSISYLREGMHTRLKRFCWCSFSSPLMAYI